MQAKLESMSEEEHRRLLAKMVDRRPGLMLDLLELQAERRAELAAAAAPPAEGAAAPPPPAEGAAAPLPWCTCSHCQEMNTEMERLCCGQTPENCVSRMAHVDLYILDEELLRLALAYWNEKHGIEEPQEHREAQRQYRHAAYRQFLAWMNDRIFEGNRSVIPSCCIWRIRETFPDPSGHYAGLKMPTHSQPYYCE